MILRQKNIETAILLGKEGSRKSEIATFQKEFSNQENKLDKDILEFSDRGMSVTQEKCQSSQFHY